MPRPLLVIKYGSASVTDEQGMDVYRLSHHAVQVARAAETHRIIIVSSGSVAAGRSFWQRVRKQADPDIQSLAMMGSAATAQAWQRALQEHGLTASQLLVTHREVEGLRRQGTLRRAITANLQHDIIPIINENDAISEQELAELAYGGDNDGLGAHVAVAMQADRLLLLTEAPAVLDEAGKRVSQVAYDLRRHEAVKSYARAGNAKGRGGMASKIAAACQAASSGLPAHIGAADDTMADIISGKSGTYFMPRIADDRVE